MSTVNRLVLTVGHSSHPLDAFVALLQKHQVTAVGDVRSAPYSRYNPQFNREDLAQRLAAKHIKYVFLGRELGARSDDAACYENGRVQYARLARTESFGSGLARVIEIARDDRLALMCAEKDPLECHRTLLVARALVDSGVVVHHILADGRLESHEAAMDRLLDVTGLPHQDLFRSNEELVADALARQEQRVAFVTDKQSASIARETP